MIQLGIDVGKSKIDLCLKSEGPDGRKKTKVLNNGPDVAVEVLEWLMQKKVPISDVQVVMEPTGTYHEYLAYGLYDRAVRVVIANPARVRAFAHSRRAWAFSPKMIPWMLMCWPATVPCGSLKPGNLPLRPSASSRRLSADEMRWCMMWDASRTGLRNWRRDGAHRLFMRRSERFWAHLTTSWRPSGN
ncbi:transposase [Mangrovibacter plantisponsor]|uniref:Transposase n=1 Tax=Mangrovibacter plantisponsor TaxID=451513 RepID=A0A317PX52_9ENTR|nr:transposase [Mangrovibacter plantisponsor]